MAAMRGSTPGHEAANSVAAGNRPGLNGCSGDARGNALAAAVEPNTSFPAACRATACALRHPSIGALSFSAETAGHFVCTAVRRVAADAS